MNTKQANKQVQAIVSNHVGFNVVLDNSFKAMLAYELAANGEKSMIAIYEKHTTSQF
jgi:hypothetical protein